MRRTERNDFIGRVILEWRERRGFTQEELAARACLGVSSIGIYERGERRPSRERLARICIALDVDPETLFVEVARAEADALKPLIEKVRKEEGQSARQRQPSGISEASDLFFLAARVSHSSGNPGGLDALVRLISKINLSAPMIEPKPDQG
jgi:transcriptional regulator with XRE-family HTH domain